MLYLPAGLPAMQSVEATPYPLNRWQEVCNAKRVLLLNLMPQKSVTECDIARTLAATRKDVQLIPVKIKGQHYKTTPQEHMDAFYLDVEDLMEQRFDGMILTGAPLEQIPFEEVRYWQQLCNIMDWADMNIERTLYICWGAQAGLYHFYAIDKYALPAKKFGVFYQKVLEPQLQLMDGLSPAFPMPNSRHTEVRKDEVLEKLGADACIVAESEESGVGIVATMDLKRTFIVGHLEYEPITLHNEYHRDLDKHLPIQAPLHYYQSDGSVDYSWSTAAIRFYANWIG